MKNKNMIALVLGICCLMVLSIVLIWSAFDKPDEPDQEVQQPPVDNVDNTPQTPPQTPNNPAEDETESSDTDEPNDNPDNVVVSPSTDPEPDPSDEPVHETPVSKPVGGQYGSSLNPNPRTVAEIQAVLNDPFMILVNRDRKVNSDYVGSDLVTYTGAYKLNSTCAAALRDMINAGKKAGYSYTLYSGYRSYSSQHNKYYNKINSHKENGKTEEEAIRLTNQYYAPPGASEHHTGLAADVCIPAIVNKYACLHEAYDQTEEFEWFSANAHKFGFILRYPLGDEDITGYNYEPWHYRFVGTDVATEIYNRNITLEEYVTELESRLAQLQG